MSAPSEAPAAPLRAILSQIARGEALTASQAEETFTAIMTGAVSPAAVGGILLSLRARGEQPQEIAGAVSALRNVMRRVEHAAPDSLVDTCGTGGGEVTTINLSTAAAFVAAGAGVPIAKHGNRSFTSRSGSADVLEAMGIAIQSEPDAASRILTENGLVFLFAPTYHPAMRHVGPIRQALGVPTIMNLIGPLANPAGVRRQVVGVADRARAPLIAAALAQMDTLHAWVVRGEIGMDEISPLGASHVWEVRDGAVREWSLNPSLVGMATTSLDGLEGGEPEENAARLMELFASPARAHTGLAAAVILNAAAAIVVSGGVASLRDAVEAARASLYEGRAQQRLEALQRAMPISTS